MHTHRHIPTSLRARIHIYTHACIHTEYIYVIVAGDSMQIYTCTQAYIEAYTHIQHTHIYTLMYQTHRHIHSGADT